MTALSNTDFLVDLVTNNDILKVYVTASLGSQTLRARIEAIYASGKIISPDMAGTEIEFVHAPAHWGNTALVPGEKAILFVTPVSNLIYEKSWNGHMVIEDIDEAPYAIIKLKAIWERPTIPEFIRKNSRQDPKRPYASAIRLDALETYIYTLLKSPKS